MAASLLIFALTGVALRAARWRYLLVGWLWFLGTLVPTIGVVQVGAQAIADRYVYVPAIGLFVIVAFGAADVLAARTTSRRAREMLAGSLSIALVVSLAGSVRSQVTHWRDSVSLFEHALEVTGPNAVIHNELGVFLQSRDDHEPAVRHFKLALQIAPDDSAVHNNFGVSLHAQGQGAAARRAFERSLALSPNYVPAHVNLGTLHLTNSRLKRALAHLEKSLDLSPDNIVALTYVARIIVSHPDPQIRNPARAIELAQRALALSPDPDLILLDTLAVAYATAGRYEAAIDSGERALALAREAGDPAAEQLRDRLEIYQERVSGAR